MACCLNLNARSACVGAAYVANICAAAALTLGMSLCAITVCEEREYKTACYVMYFILYISAVFLLYLVMSFVQHVCTATEPLRDDAVNIEQDQSNE